MKTLTLEYASVERSFKDWGFGDVQIQRVRSRAAGTFELSVPGPAAVLADLIPFEGLVKIRYDGKIVFQGRRLKHNGTMNPRSPGASYTFADAWYDLEHTVFQHLWRWSATPAPFPFINLFQDITAGPDAAWGYLQADDQIEEIVNFAQTTVGLPIQIGAVDPAWNLPVYAVKGITCAEAIIQVLRSIPDAVTFFDYTTTPPTLHVKQRANLSSVSLPWLEKSVTGQAHASTEIEERPDLRVPQVVVYYRSVTSVDGENFTSFSADVYPPLSNGLVLRGLVIPVDLRGTSSTTLSGSLTTVAVNPTVTSFWQKFKPDLAGADISSLSLVSTTIGSGQYDITIKDDAGSDVSIGTYPNKLVSGTVASWMSVTVKEVTVTGFLKYTKRKTDDAGSNYYDLTTQEAHKVTVRMRLTNAPAGETPYSAVSSVETGEPALTGVAQNIYEACQTLEYEGRHVVQQRDVSLYGGSSNQPPGPQFTLNLTGGKAAWATMATAVYETEIDYYNGRTTWSFGPHLGLDAREFYDLLTAWSRRQKFENPNVRNSGKDAGANSGELGAETEKENTEDGVADTSLTTALSAVSGSGGSARRVAIQHDAPNGAILVKTIKPDGTRDTATPYVNLRNADLGGSREAKWREYTVCEEDTGGTKKIRIPSSAPE